MFTHSIHGVECASKVRVAASEGAGDGAGWCDLQLLLQCWHPSADVVKKCALIAFHEIAEEGRNGDGCHVPSFEDERKVGCPKSPMWESEGEAWSEDESVSSCGSREGNVCNDASHVIGLHGHGGKISYFLKDWELTKVALSCHMALDMLCQEMHEAWWSV